MTQSHNYSIIRLKEVDSTNTWAKKAFNEKIAQSGAAIVAATQREGRGQMRTKWHDEEGENLLFTLIIDTQMLRATNFFRLSEAVSLALIDVLEEHVSPHIKWPNDIWVGDKKIAGILIETIIQGEFIKTAFIGIGINVNQINFPIGLSATSLALLTNQSLDLEQLLKSVLIAVESRIAQMQTPDVLARQYFAQLLGTNHYLKYKDDKGSFLAKVNKVEDNGRLVLQVEGEPVLRYYHFKEVKLLRD